MKKPASKLIVFGAIVFLSSMTSCKTGSGYGCDFTEANTPCKLDKTDASTPQVSKHTYKMVRNVTE